MLHLDLADHYGSQWASLSLDAFLAWAGAAAERPAVDADAQASCSPASRNESVQQQPAAHLASLQAAPDTANEAGEPAALLEVPCTCWRVRAQAYHHLVFHTSTGLVPIHKSMLRAGVLQALRKLTGAVPAAGGLPAVEVSVPSADSSLYTHVEVEKTEKADLGASREYNIDLAPKVWHSLPYPHASSMHKTCTLHGRHALWLCF